MLDWKRIHADQGCIFLFTFLFTLSLSHAQATMLLLTSGLLACAHRSQRYKGRLFSSHGRMVRTVFWAVVLLAAVLAFLTFCAAPPGRSASPRPQPRFVNGKARRF